MPTPAALLPQVLAAQASYGLLNGQDTLQALIQSGLGDLPPAAARRFLGVGEFIGQGLRLLDHTPNWLTGFSASVFRDTTTGKPILAIRGSEGPIDYLQDAKLSL